MLATWGTSTGFNPATLFAGGVQGAWYDPSDNTTMFQDSTGTTPVTAVEQAVGLILDKSKGLVIGSELVTNGGPFVNTTGWTGQNSATLSVASAKLRVSGNGVTAFPFASTPFTTIVGRGYVINANLAFVSGVNDSVYIQKSDAAATVVNGVTSGAAPATSKTLFFVATATTTYLQLVSDDATDVYDWDNISVRELAGNHAFQSTSASRPTLRARYNLLERSEEFNNAYWSLARCTISPDTVVAPNGTTTADSLVEDTTSNSHPVFRTIANLVTGTYVGSCYIKAAGRTQARIAFANTAFPAAGYVNFDLSLVTATGVNGATGTITDVGNGWYRCTATVSATAAGSGDIYIQPLLAGAASYLGTGITALYIWGAQLIQSSVFPSNVYQRIAAATDYATGAAFPQYLAFDGTDDSLLTSSVDFATVTSDGQARRNLLLNPTQFDDAAWTKIRASISANSAIAPDGTTTADTLIEDTTASNSHLLYNTSAVSVTNATTYTYSIYAKPAGRSWINLVPSFSSASAYFDVQNGVVGTVSNGTASISSVGNGWFRCSLTFASTATSGFLFTQLATANGVNTYTGDGTSGIFLWGAQLETGSTATAFQNIGTDKMTVFSGLSKLSDAAQGTVAELGNRNFVQAGSFSLTAPRTIAPTYGFIVEGTAVANLEISTYTAPITSVVTAVGDISADITALRVNGIAATPSSTDLGTGNFGNYPLFIGSRNQASLRFNGRIYSLIVRGAQSNSTQIAQTERYVASKTPLGVVP